MNFLQYKVDIEKHETNNDLLLHYCEYKNDEMIKYMLDTYCILDDENINNENQVSEIKINQVNEIKNNNRIDINYKTNDHRYTPLMWCCWLNIFDSVKEILKYKPDIDYYNNHYDCAILLAIYNGNYEMVKLLIDNGADVNLILDDEKKHRQNEISPISTSVYNGDYKITKLLIDNGADVNYMKVGSEIKSPLIYSAIKGYYEIAKLLIMNGADINYQYNDCNAFNYALYNKCYKICILLLINGADVNDNCIRVVGAKQWIIGAFNKIVEEKKKEYDSKINILYNDVANEYKVNIPKVLCNMIVYDYLYDEDKYKFDDDIIKFISVEYKKNFASQFEEHCNCNRNNNN